MTTTPALDSLSLVADPDTSDTTTTSSLETSIPSSLQQLQQPQQQQHHAVVDWPTEAVSYELLGKIGQGAFATVWRARTTSHLPATTGAADLPNEISTRECAVKILNLDNVDTNLVEIRLEVQAMRLSSHPNVLTCYTAFVQDVHLWLVTPLMRKGSSLHCLQAARRALKQQQPSLQQETSATNPSSSPATASMEEHILYILHETLLGLQYIHDNGQIHRDIKAGNILLDGNADVRIADFGVSGWLIQAGSQQEKAKTFVGTPCWMAPEVMEQVHGYDYKADIWSLGITALELARGYAPYAKYPPMKVLILTIQEDPPSLESYVDEDEDDDDLTASENYSKTFCQMVDWCLQKNPARRPNCQELLHSRYFGAFKNDPDLRQARREATRTGVCDLVRDVGVREDTWSTANTGSPPPRLPGNSPVSIVSSPQEKDRPPGTTWVFADGSSVFSSSATAAEVDDVLAQIDEFGRQTGGEHYCRVPASLNEVATELQPPAGPATHQKEEEEEDDDDLDKFMDEFEQNVAGEDFRRDPGQNQW